MSFTFRGKTHELLNARLLDVLKQCRLKEKLGKEVSLHKVPVKIKTYQYWLVFGQPAKVMDVNYDKLEVDIQMKTSLVSVDAHFPENEGTSTVRYKMSYEAFSQVIQLRSATIVEMSFGTHLLKPLKEGMKKKAGNLNLNFSVEKCF